MAPVSNLNVDVGATFQVVFSYTDPNGAPIDLTGFTAHMQVRTSTAAESTVLDITPAVDGPTGTVTVRLGADQTVLLPPSEACVYDVKLTDSVDATNVIRLVQGIITAHAEVTR